MSRTAVVLFNLGGPDRPEAVRPFLRNLFRDPAILRVPAPLRLVLAWAIARRREAFARDMYARIGGGSPLLAETEKQARALEAALGPDFRAFVAMRYWHPFGRETAVAVAAWKPDRILLLPLYPQYSTTTTASSFGDWRCAANAAGLGAPTMAVCCYPTLSGMVAAQARAIEAALAGTGANVRLLLSAHGLPERIARAGDPYAAQVEMTARAIVAELARANPARAALDWRVCYQSRVGRIEWLKPYTDEEIRRAGAEAREVVVAPIAFVSEHSETLVELDMLYADVAQQAGVKRYIRVPALGAQPDFIAGLAGLARAALADGAPLRSSTGARICPAECGGCALAGVAV